MIEEIKKSVNSILYERLTSPFYGALFASWFIWNWKIPYLSLFVSEKNIEPNKLEYIINHFSDFNILITYPLISTAVILTILPFITNGFYWLHIKFRKWRLDQKNILELKTLLTLEQSIQLREEVLKSEEVVEKLLERKNQEIKELQLVIESFTEKNISKEIDESDTTEKYVSSVSEIAKKISNNKELKSSFDEAVYYIQGGYSNLMASEKTTPKAIAFLEANHLIVGKEKGIYSMTDLGKDVLKQLLSDNF